jgi:hypothetical protein
MILLVILKLIIAAIQKFSDKGKDLMLLKIGESIEL